MTTYRRATMADLLLEQPINSKQEVVITKNQQHFSERKRIKPWRTGSKSQQQIVPKGYKKGFRK